MRVSVYWLNMKPQPSESDSPWMFHLSHLAWWFQSQHGQNHGKNMGNISWTYHHPWKMVGKWWAMLGKTHGKTVVKTIRNGIPSGNL